MAFSRFSANRLFSLALVPVASIATVPLSSDFGGQEIGRAADFGHARPASGGLPQQAQFGRDIPDVLTGTPPPEQARLINSAIPFSNSLGSPAAPLHLSGDADSQARAVDCLASAMIYEAGGDIRGQRAVGQVVLNRVRHAMFPKSVCGVVFQGSERRTGCQFTFTCDGAMGRVPSAAAFTRARAEAKLMLDGAVDAEVGAATHYHTDWVHPVWSGAMQKVASVDTHLFFRWPGAMGSKAEMRGVYAGREPAIAKLAGLSPAHRKGFSAAQLAGLAAAAKAQPVDAEAADAKLAAAAGQPVTIALAPPPAPRPGVFDLTVDQAAGAGAPARAALGLCGDRQFCKVVGRAGPGVANNGMVFLYVRDQRTGVDQVLWDCQLFPRKSASQCLGNSSRNWSTFDGNLGSARSQNDG